MVSGQPRGPGPFPTGPTEQEIRWTQETGWSLSEREKVLVSGIQPPFLSCSPRHMITVPPDLFRLPSIRDAVRVKNVKQSL